MAELLLLENDSVLLKEDDGKLQVRNAVDYKFSFIMRNGINTTSKVIIRNGTGGVGEYVRGDVIDNFQEVIAGDKTDAELRTYYNAILPNYGDAGYSNQQ